jgi:hypothetical protein
LPRTVIGSIGRPVLSSTRATDGFPLGVAQGRSVALTVKATLAELYGEPEAISAD